MQVTSTGLLHLSRLPALTKLTVPGVKFSTDTKELECLMVGPRVVRRRGGGAAHHTRLAGAHAAMAMVQTAHA